MLFSYHSSNDQWGCTVMTARKFPVTIMGRPSRSAATVPQMYTFESLDQNGKALCLGETVILPDEINSFISKHRQHGILITALHNHWLYNHPQIMFIHFQSIDNPLSFAHKVRDALTVLGP
ncbi:DUF1259 domain-containing protein [Paenibacillus sp. P26]|nr:DUF1259 domain-containing protein [Paenibacillus sp. P26]UUZ95169.1 DUF1259 domain-containing protein [Paenibacillus sp. P25]